MQASEVPRAVAVAMSTASSLDLTVDDAIVLHDSNKLAVRLLPCDVLARVAPTEHQVAQFEVELAQRLAETGSPAAAQQLVESSNLTPELADADRELLISTLRSRRQAIGDRGAAEQLLHGEPHPGNLLSTKTGLLFIDLETCCRGPVEFDLAHVPEDVSERYPDADEELLSDCRVLALAMVAAWRWDPGDQFPDGQRAGRELLCALREGPPWPTLDVVMGRQDAFSRLRRS